MAAFVRLLGAPDQFWLVHAPGSDPRGDQFLAALGGTYAVAGEQEWGDEGMLRVAVTEFRRTSPG